MDAVTPPKGVCLRLQTLIKLASREMCLSYFLCKSAECNHLNLFLSFSGFANAGVSGLRELARLLSICALQHLVAWLLLIADPSHAGFGRKLRASALMR